MTSKAGNRRGSFTLLETLLTLVIISVLLGTGFPVMRSRLNKTRFYSFVNKTYLLLDYARSHATLKNTVLAVHFDLERGALFLEEGEEEKNTLKIPDAVEIELEQERVFFYPDGTSQEFKASLSDKHKHSSVILSRGFDGKIRIEDDEQ